MTKARNCTTLKTIDFHSMYMSPLSCGIGSYHAVSTSNPASAAEPARALDYSAMNIFNGGQQAGNNLDFKKFMIVPLENPPCGSTANVHQSLRYHKKCTHPV